MCTSLPLTSLCTVFWVRFLKGQTKAFPALTAYLLFPFVCSALKKQMVPVDAKPGASPDAVSTIQCWDVKGDGCIARVCAESEALGNRLLILMLVQVSLFILR